MARRRVIDLDRDLPARATRPADGALAKVFGGCQTSGNFCEAIGGQPRCCPGLSCVTYTFFPGLDQKTCAAA